MAGFQAIYEERWEPGPDGKLVKKVYTVRRDLTDQQAEELFNQKIQQIEPVFADMFKFIPPSPKSTRARGLTSLDDLFQAINEFFSR